MSDIAMAGFDLAKNVFQVHGADDEGRAVLRKKLRFAPMTSKVTSAATMVFVFANF